MNACALEEKENLFLDNIDRLAAYIHWNDKQGLEQAIMVAQAQEFKPASIKRFCEREGSSKTYKEFVDGIRKRKAK